MILSNKLKQIKNPHITSTKIALYLISITELNIITKYE